MYQQQYQVAPTPSVQQYQYPNNTYGYVDSVNQRTYTRTAEITGGGAQMISEERTEAEGPINGMTRIAALGPLTVIKTAFGEYSITEVRRNRGSLGGPRHHPNGRRDTRLFAFIRLKYLHQNTLSLTHTHTQPLFFLLLSRRESLNQGLTGPFKIV